MYKWKLGNKYYLSRLLHCFGNRKGDKIFPELAVELVKKSGTEFLTLYTHVNFNNIRSVYDFPLGYSGLKLADIKDKIDVGKYTLLINTNHALSAQEAIYRSIYSTNILGKNTIIKLEVLTKDFKKPNNEEVFHAASVLIGKGFKVIALIDKYDITLAKKLEKIGCLAVRILLSNIGTGGGFNDEFFFKRITKEVNIPVIAEGGIKTPDDVYLAMSNGATAALVNRALFCTKNPIFLIETMKEASISGLNSYLSKKMIDNNKFDVDI